MRSLSRLLRACFFAAALCSSAQAYQLVDKVVAVVEEDVVLASEVREQMIQVRSNIRGRGVALPPEDVLYEQVLERAILDRLQLQRAQRLGLRVTDQELNEAMTSIARNNGVSLSEFRRLLLQQGESYVAVRERVRHDLLIRQVQQRSVIRAININKSEVESFLESDRGQALVQPEWQIDHLLMDVDSFSDQVEVARKRVLFSGLRDEAIAAGSFQAIVNKLSAAGVSYQPLGWLDNASLPTLFSDAVKKLGAGEVSDLIQSDSGFHLIRLADTRGGAAGSIRESKVRHILIAENAIRDYDQGKTLIEKVRQRILEGEDFANLARKFSDDPGSALSGGELGWVEPGKMVPEFDAAMNEVEVEELSPVIRSVYGWHILQVLERRDRDGFEERSRQIARQRIAETKYDDALQNWLQELRDNAYVEIK